MNIADIATTAVALQQAKTQTTIETVMLRMQHEMDMALIDMLASASQARKSPPPAGMGTIVDETV